MKNANKNIHIKQVITITAYSFILSFDMKREVAANPADNIQRLKAALLLVNPFLIKRCERWS
jgi:hypothetical protein